MTTFTFDRGMADSVRDQMATITKNLQTELQNMDTQVRAALGDWTGQDKDQYEFAKREWDAAAARMPSSLNRAETVLNVITDGYLKIEHQGMNSWSGYNVR
ncbi:WXG100 family type VII secretion target [Lentzea sp. NPDC059081]|uniref:WXG100 family type VII secretion target n=1 Tax=Lentzea sp. NPDC059081 TaxID=3346719 RepID=UPI0036B744F9